jgi:hypothetical protein
VETATHSIYSFLGFGYSQHKIGHETKFSEANPDAEMYSFVTVEIYYWSLEAYSVWIPIFMENRAPPYTIVLA